MKNAQDFFPERYFQRVLVLRTENSVLWNRLTSRGYSAEKVQENVQAEIMQVILEEAREAYKPELVLEVRNDNIQQLQANIATAVQVIASLSK
jgi:adenylate kinase